MTPQSASSFDFGFIVPDSMVYWVVHKVLLTVEISSEVILELYAAIFLANFSSGANDLRIVLQFTISKQSNIYGDARFDTL